MVTREASSLGGRFFIFRKRRKTEMKKLLSLLVALMMILTLGACSSKTDETAGGDPAGG